MKGKTLLCLALVTSMLLSVMIGPVSAQTTMGVEPVDTVDETLVPGSTFTVSIWVRNVLDLAGPEFKLGYDTTVLTATEIVDGGLYEFYFPLISVINDAEGYLHYSIMELTGVASFDGDGIIATITFTVDSVGESALDLYDTVLGDSLGDPIPHDVIDGYFNNIPEVTGTLTVTTMPVDGDIFVDLAYVGTGSFTGEFDAGWYTVSFGDVFCHVTPDPQTVEVVAGETTTVTGVYVAITTGTLTVTTMPVDGDIFVDLAYVGTGSFTGVFEEGDYLVSFGPVEGYTTPADELAHVSPCTETIVEGVYEEIVVVPVWRIDLIRRSAWPEHHHHVVAKHTTTIKLFAIIANVGTEATYGKVTFTVTSATGIPLDNQDTEPFYLEPGQIHGNKKDLRYSTDWVAPGTGKYNVTAEVWYDADGDLSTEDWTKSLDKPKTFSFSVVP